MRFTKIQGAGNDYVYVNCFEEQVADPAALADWFYQGAYRGDLGGYLEGFAHTIAVTQTAEALERVAYEQVEDLKNDGVVYFETRFAPIFHTKKGLTNMDVVAAVLKGLERGQRDFTAHARLRESSSGGSASSTIRLQAGFQVCSSRSAFFSAIGVSGTGLTAALG